MTPIAVVPIFVSAGAAVLPTLLAGVATVAAVLLKPRELLRLLRQIPIPWAGGIVAVVLGAIIVAGGWKSGLFASTVHGDSRPVPRHDWAKVAEDILALEAAGNVPTVVGAVADSAAPLVLGRDFSRCSYDGGVSPLRLKPIWTFRPDDTMFLAQSAVVGKRIFTAGCQLGPSGYTGLLACLDADSGNPIWQVTQAGDDILRPFFSSPAITRDGKSLLIGGGLHDDHDCALQCFSTDTGQLRWSVKTTLHIESSPAIFADIVVVGAGAIEGKDGKATGDPGHVIGVRISDGKELWRQPVNDPESSPAIDDQGTVYIGSGFNGSAIFALRSASDEDLRDQKLSRVLWRTDLSLPVTSAITLAGDLVIAGAGNGDFVFSNPHPQGRVVALDRATGQIRWQSAFDDAVLGSLAFRDGRVICSARSGEIIALNAADGKIIWRVHPRGKTPILAGCAFTGSRVYALSSDGFLFVIDAKDGLVLQKHLLNAEGKPGSGLSVCSPQVAGGQVLVGSETGGLQCLLGTK